MKLLLGLLLAIAPTMHAEASDIFDCKLTAKILSIDTKEVAGKKEVTLSLEKLSAKSNDNRHSDASCDQANEKVFSFEPDNDSDFIASLAAVGDKIEITERQVTSERDDGYFTSTTRTFVSIQSTATSQGGPREGQIEPKKVGSCQIDPTSGGESALALLGLLAWLRSRAKG